jgi:hypothetical protein
MPHRDRRYQSCQLLWLGAGIGNPVGSFANSSRTPLRKPGAAAGQPDATTDAEFHGANRSEDAGTSGRSSLTSHVADSRPTPQCNRTVQTEFHQLVLAEMLTQFAVHRVIDGEMVGGEELGEA